MSKASREQQILIAERVLADRGFSPWSSYARKLGLAVSGSGLALAMHNAAPTM